MQDQQQERHQASEPECPATTTASYMTEGSEQMGRPKKEKEENNTPLLELDEHSRATSDVHFVMPHR